ncbi:hypothetical protein [Streptomyces longispororuber]|uniref:hypothetical protein n=1 Tax=Streptomyces longispororuber TaxID=68230 RepID=UPI00167E1F48|nr:hypothetical protein [Streptomyces longispororuber]
MPEHGFSCVTGGWLTDGSVTGAAEACTGEGAREYEAEGSAFATAMPGEAPFDASGFAAATAEAPSIPAVSMKGTKIATILRLSTFSPLVLGCGAGMWFLGNWP